MRKAKPGSTWTEGELDSYRETLSKHVAKAEGGASIGAKKQCVAAPLPKTIAMLPNAIAAKAHDRTMLLSCNYGLKAVRQEGRGTPPLSSGESRYFVDASELPKDVLEAGEVGRSCIETATGERCLEIENEEEK